MNKYWSISLLISLLFFNCSGSNTELSESLEKNIREHIKKAALDSTGYSVFKLSSITNFEWDKFYIFDDSNTNDFISVAMGTEFQGSSIPGGNKRIIFIFKNKVVDYLDYEPISFPLFIYSCEPSFFYKTVKQDDPFIVFQKRNEIYPFAMVPFRCKDNFLKKMYKYKK